MRKHFSFALVMAVITMLCLASCENKQDETNSTSVPTTAQGAQKRLTGEEQLEKLNSLGEQILSNFKTQEQADLIRLTDYLTAHFENTDWSAVMDSAGAGHASYAAMQPAMATLRRLSAYAYYAPMNLMDAAIDNWYVSDFFGEFEFYEGLNKWRFKGQNDNAAIFRCADQNGKEVVVTIKATGDVHSIIDTVKVYDYKSNKRTYTVDYWDEKKSEYIEDRVISETYYQELLKHRDDDHEGGDDYFSATYEGVHYYVHVSYPFTMQPYALHIPSNLAVTLTDDGKELVNIALTFDIDRKDHVKMVGNIRLANIVQNYDFNITRSAIRGTYGMTVNGNPICNLVINNDGFNALAIDPNNNLRTEKDFNKYAEKVESELKPGKTNILFTILGGEMSIQGEMDGDTYYTQMRHLSETSFNSEEDYSKAVKDIWNNNILLSVYYGSNIKQAEIVMVVDDLEHDLRPAIYFIEDRNVAVQFDQFFTRRSFGSLIDSTEVLINTYIDLFKDNKIEPIDL